MNAKHARQPGDDCFQPIHHSPEQRSMNTSPATSTLFKPTGDTPIPGGTFSYFRGRNRFRIYEIIVKEFLKSGLTQATLARRLGRRPEVVNRVLGAPANLTLDTVSDFLFAISGAEPTCGVQYPLDQAPRNYRGPEWLSGSETGTSGAPIIGKWQTQLTTPLGRPVPTRTMATTMTEIH